MPIAKRLGGTLAALACAGLPALSAAPDSPGRCGFTLLAGLPRQDFRDLTGRTGLGVGVFAESELGSGTILQTRVDYLQYPQTNQPQAGAIAAYTVPGPRTLAANSVALGVDLRHPLPLPGLERGFALAGVLAIRYEFDTSGLNTLTDQNGLPIGGIRRYKDKTPFRLGLAVGLGFELYRGMTLTERYTAVNINGATLATFETGLSFRF